MQNKYLPLLLSILISVYFTPVIYAQSDMDYYELAKAEGKKKNFSKATEYCLKGIKESPKDLDLQEYLGKCYLETGKFDQARLTLLSVLRQSPDRDDSRRYLVTIESLTNRYASAICYINELLETNPYDKDLWLKKVAAYKQLHNDVEAEKSIKRLAQIFPNDENVRETYNFIIKQNATAQIKKENLEDAAAQYQSAITNSKRDLEMYINLANTQIKLGDQNAALATINKGLFFLPNNTELLAKKAGILESQGNYSQAINSLEQKLKTSNDPALRSQLNYLMSESARQQINNDPYVIYSKLYQNGGNPEALTYLLNTAIERGKYDDAQEIVTKELRKNPNNKQILLKQLIIYERTHNTKKIDQTIERLHEVAPTDADINAKFAAMKFNNAKNNMNNQQYKEAIKDFLIVARYSEYQVIANENLYSCFKSLKNFDEANQIVEQLLVENPHNEKYYLLKAHLLTDNKQFDQALELYKQFNTQFPHYQGFKAELDEFSSVANKHFLSLEKYPEVITISNYVISVTPDNYQAYAYSINAQTAQKQFGEAISSAELALRHFPDDKTLKLKLAGLQSELKNHEKSADILAQLKKQFPFNDTISNAWIEQMQQLGKQFEENNALADASNIYDQILNSRPKDITSRVKLSSILLELKDREKAMQIIDEGLLIHPNQNDLLLQKAIICEANNDIGNAIRYYEQYNPPVEKSSKIQAHILFLKSKSFSNEFIVSYTKIKSDSILINNSVASLEYIHLLNPNNSLTGRVNYIGKNSGVGIQGEIDWYHTLKNKSSLLISGGVSSKFFQKIKLSASYFIPIKNDWQAEIGARYAKLSNNEKLYTGILGIEKQINSIWINAKGFYMQNQEESYYNTMLQTRFYMLNDRDYLTVLAAVGNAPEDQRLDFQLNNFLSYANSMIGAGYKYNLTFKSALTLMTNWYNFKMTNTSYLNQYNINVSFATKF